MRQTIFNVTNVYASTAQQQPLNPYNRLPSTQNQRLPYDWWQKLQDLLRPQDPNPDSVGKTIFFFLLLLLGCKRGGGTLSKITKNT